VGFELDAEGRPAPVPVCFPPTPAWHDERLGWAEPGLPAALPDQLGDDGIERLADTFKPPLVWLRETLEARRQADVARLLGLRTCALLWAIDRRLLAVKSQSELAHRLAVSKQRLGQTVKVAKRLLRVKRRET
jgi:hypothetical protein